jgi:cobalt-zinc-cadmium efflux system outer membrane protein
LEWQRARLAALPDATVGAAYGRDAAADEDLVEFRVALPLPLFDRGQGQQQAARAEAEIAAAHRDSTAQELAQQLAAAMARMQAAQEQVIGYRTRILPKAEKALELVRGGFAAGKFGFLDLVDTQRTAAEARLAYLDKLLELNLAHADWEALAGVEPRN